VQSVNIKKKIARKLGIDDSSYDLNLDKKRQSNHTQTKKLNEVESSSGQAALTASTKDSKFRGFPM